MTIFKNTAKLILMIIQLSLISVLFGCATPKQIGSEITETVEIARITKDSTIIKYVPKIIYKDTNIYITKAFRTQFDTIIKKVYNNKTIYDTIKLIYNYPENTGNFSSKKSVDTVFTKLKTIKTHEIKDKPWWEYPIYLGSALLLLAIGLLIGKFTAKRTIKL